MVNHSPSWYLDVLRDLGKRNDNSKFHQISIADSQSLQCSKCTNVSTSMILNLPVQAIRIGVNSCSSFSQPAGDLSKSLCMCQLSATLLRLMAFNPSAGDASEFLAAFLRTPGCSDEKSMYYIYILLHPKASMAAWAQMQHVSWPQGTPLDTSWLHGCGTLTRMMMVMDKWVWRTLRPLRSGIAASESSFHQEYGNPWESITCNLQKARMMKVNFSLGSFTFLFGSKNDRFQRPRSSPLHSGGQASCRSRLLGVHRCNLYASLRVISYVYICIYVYSHTPPWSTCNILQYNLM